MSSTHDLDRMLRRALARRAAGIDPLPPPWPPPSGSALRTVEPDRRRSLWPLVAAAVLVVAGAAVAVSLGPSDPEKIEAGGPLAQSTVPPTTHPAGGDDQPAPETLPAAPEQPPPDISLGYVPDGWEVAEPSAPPNMRYLVLRPSEQNDPPAETDFRRLTVTLSRYEFPQDVRAALDADDLEALVDAWRAHLGPDDGVESYAVTSLSANGGPALRVDSTVSANPSGAAADDRGAVAIVTFPGHDLVIQVTGEQVSDDEVIEVARGVALDP